MTELQSPKHRKDSTVKLDFCFILKLVSSSSNWVLSKEELSDKDHVGNWECFQGLVVEFLFWA